MGKVKMQYRTAPMVNPATKQHYTDKRSVHIVNLRNYNIDELVKFALDNNYIEGAKYELAKGILKGAVEAERALVLAGNAVSIDGWVKYEPRLKGSVSADKRVLTKENSLVIGINALKEMKLTLDTFSWQLTDEGFKPTPDPDPEPVGIPSITNAKSTGYADRTVNIGGGDLTVEGENIATATEVKFLDPDGSEFYTVPVTYADGKLVAADGTVRTEGPANGSVKVTTEGGTATLDVTFTTP